MLTSDEIGKLPDEELLARLIKAAERRYLATVRADYAAAQESEREGALLQHEILQRMKVRHRRRPMGF